MTEVFVTENLTKKISWQTMHPRNTFMKVYIVFTFKLFFIVKSHIKTAVALTLLIRVNHRLRTA